MSVHSLVRPPGSSAVYRPFRPPTGLLIGGLLIAVLCAPLTALRAQAVPASTPSPGRGGALSPVADTLVPMRLLARLQAEASSRSPELAARRAQRDAARTRATATGFAQPLALSAGLSEAPNASLDQGNVRVEIGRELFAAPRLRAERAVAEIDVRTAEATLAAAERRVRLTAWRETIRAAGARIIAARLSAEDSLLAGAEEGVRARFSVGQSRYVDVLRLRTERLRVQTERAATVAESRAAVAALGGLLGRVGDPGIPHARRATDDAPLAATLDSLSTSTLVDAWRVVLPGDGRSDTLMDSVMATAGEVQLADAEVARAVAQRALATAARRPQVTASAGLQRIGQANNGPALGPSMAITISLPFTARRGNTLGAVADAERVTAMERSRTATLAAVRARIEGSAERFAAARERLAVYDAALLRGARDERESALASYRSGGLSLLELVDFERALARAEIDRIRALVDAATAWADLSSGGDSAAPPALPSSGSALEEFSHGR